MSVHEIARRAGVSITTVSRVLNNNPSVRPETASQVRKVLEQFPYDRNAIRRGPRPGKRVKHRASPELKHGAISIVVLGLTHEHWFKQPIFASIVSAITRAAADRHLSVRVEEVMDADISESISSNVVDGALAFVHSTAPPGLLDMLKARLPVVRVMGDDLVTTGIDQVRPDNVAIGQAAFEYLSGHGCRNLACVTTRPFHGGIQLRMFGFAAAANHSGLGMPKLFSTGDQPYGPWVGVKAVSCPSFEELAAAVAASEPRPDGIFVSQDVESVGLYPLLAARGMRPGQDLRIISCNNDDALALLSPRPATIDLNSGVIGRWAVRRLISRIARPEDAPIQILVKPTVVQSPERSSPHG